MKETLCRSLLRSGGGRVDDDDHENDGDEDDYDNDDDADYDYDDDDYDEQLLDHAQLPMGKWYDTGRHTCTARRRKESARARCKKDDGYMQLYIATTTTTTKTQLPSTGNI